MTIGRITIVTPPDKLFNLNIGYLLVSPSITVKQQFQSILSSSLEDINVFIYENDENDIDWLLSVSFMADVVIIDVDNCNSATRDFITFLLAQPNVYYITNDEITPFTLISKNRIFNLDWIAEQIQNDIEEDDNDDVQSED